MFFVDKPYISDIFKKTVRDLAIPVVGTPISRELDLLQGINIISSFNYEKLLSTFENSLELRKFNFKDYPVFGFLFTETNQDNTIELKRILDSDLSEFISTNEN